MRFSFRNTHPPLFSGDNQEARRHYARACANSSAAIAVLGPDLSFEWVNPAFGEALSGATPRAKAVGGVLVELGLRDLVLDVFASGQPKQTLLILPNSSQRHWKARMLGCEQSKPKRVLLTLEPVTALVEFASETGQVTWASQNSSVELGCEGPDVVGRELWSLRPFRRLDWALLLEKQLEDSAGQVLDVQDGPAGNVKHFKLSVIQRSCC